MLRCKIKTNEGKYKIKSLFSRFLGSTFAFSLCIDKVARLHDNIQKHFLRYYFVKYFGDISQKH